MSLGALRSFADQASFYGGHVLASGDSDKRHKWGGKVDTGGLKADFVKELQRDLTAVGCYDGILDGDFGGGTARAIKRFQWCLGNATHRSSTRMSLLAEIPKTQAVLVTGMLDHATARTLRAWANDGFEVTGTLRVVPLGSFAHFRKGGLSKIDHRSVGDGDMVVHKDFLAGLDLINREAGNAGVLFHVNQTLRLAGKPVKGAVVKPASRSQHLIGNAVDFNPHHNGALISSKHMQWSSLAEPVKTFITKVKAGGLRWGGDFKDRDPIHFDAFLDPDGDDFATLYFLNQRTIQKGQPILRA